MDLRRVLLYRPNAYTINKPTAYNMGLRHTLIIVDPRRIGLLYIGLIKAYII